MTLAAPVLMLVTDPAVPDLEARVSSALAAGAAWVQYRDKAATTAQRIAWVRAFKERHPNTVLLVNGDVRAAMEGGADGVHWPGSTRAWGTEGVLPAPGAERGVGTHVIGRSLHAGDLPEPDITGCDYAVFGTVFASASHPGGPVAGLDALHAACRLPRPVLAIGGVTAGNAGDCIRAGAAGVAVIRSVLMAPDPARAANEIFQAMREAMP